MAKKRYIDTKFWSDSFVRDELDPLDRYLFMYLFTNERTNICGIYELPMSIISFETGLDKNKLFTMIEKLKPKVYYINGWVYIKNFQKHQNQDNKFIKKGIEEGIKLVPRDVMTHIGLIQESSGDIQESSGVPSNLNLDYDLDSDSDLGSDGKKIITEQEISDPIFKQFKNKSTLSVKEYTSLEFDFGKKMVLDYIEDLENYIVNNPKGKHIKDCNLTLRNWFRKNGVKKIEHKEQIVVSDTDEFFTSLQKEIGV